MRNITQADGTRKMLDGISLDHLRTFLAAADAGSFSAAGRQLGRAQSAVSQSLATLEDQLGVKLFDRIGKLPTLTAAGRTLLADARAVEQGVSGLKAHARAIAGGTEAELSVSVDMMFPVTILIGAMQGFESEFPGTSLRIQMDVLGSVLQPLIDDRCSFAIVGTLPGIPSHYLQKSILEVPYVLVAAQGHALAQHRSDGADMPFDEHVQIVLSDRSGLSDGRQYCVFSSKIWSVADLAVKQEFIRAGLGWGGMPAHMVEDDLAHGRLVQLPMPELPMGDRMRMRAVHRMDRPIGPAGRWLIDRLRETAERAPMGGPASAL
jgi:DNA-binding transcriptional LysR family regulator